MGVPQKNTAVCNGEVEADSTFGEVQPGSNVNPATLGCLCLSMAVEVRTLSISKHYVNHLIYIINYIVDVLHQPYKFEHNRHTAITLMI